ncbi:MAG: S8 family serine peptidase [Coriobacteriia bacterium]|nr:S8 family serine peptidase [Coriobacteriia bacterium]
MLKLKGKRSAGLSAKAARTAISLIAAASLSLYGFVPAGFGQSAWAGEAQAASTETQASDASGAQDVGPTASSTDADTQVGKISADHVEDEVVVTYESGKTKVVSLDDDTTVEEAISEYSEKKNVAEVQPNFVYHVLDADNEADAAGSDAEQSDNAEQGSDAGQDDGSEQSSNAGQSDGDEQGSDSSASGNAEGSTEGEASGDSGGSDEGQDSGSSAATDDARLSEQYYLFGSDDQPSNSAYRGSNFVSAWNALSGSSTTTVAVLDTGCDITNPDLRGNVLSDLAYDAVSQKLVKDETDKDSSSFDYDPDGHGTHVAGEIAATANNSIGIAGAGKNLVKVLPVRVADNAGKITTESFRNGLDYILDLVKSGKVSNLHVVNVSLGYYAGPSSDETDVKVRDAIDALQDAGVVTVVAGGNGYDDTLASSGTYDRIYPSDFDECYSVSALTAYGTNATFSDYNSHKDISAPGMSVLSTARGSKSGGADGNYAKENGTSQAAPLVSSALALLWAQDSSLTTEQATYALSSTASSLSGAGLPKESASAGALNVFAALEAVKNGVTVPESTLDLFTATVEVVIPERLTSAKGEGPYACVSDDGSSFVYYGGAYEPDVRVKADGKTVNASEYSVSYANNVNPGQATVTVVANGTSKTANFTIVSDSDESKDDSGESGKSDKSTSGSTTDDSFSEEKVMKALDEGGSSDASDEDESDDDTKASGLTDTADVALWAPFSAVAVLAVVAALLARSRKQGQNTR